MTHPEFANRIRRIIGDQLGFEVIAVLPESRLVADLDADSLDAPELIMAFEEEFAIDLDDTFEEWFTSRDRTLAEVVAKLRELNGLDP